MALSGLFVDRLKGQICSGNYNDNNFVNIDETSIGGSRLVAGRYENTIIAQKQLRMLFRECIDNFLVRMQPMVWI